MNKLSKILPELGENQLKMLERLILECLPKEPSYPELMAYVELLKNSGENRDMIFEAAYMRAIQETTHNIKELLNG